MSLVDKLKLSIQAAKLAGDPPETWRRFELQIEAIQSIEFKNIIINETCLACFGTTVLGEFTTDKQHDCPWCNATGSCSKEVNDTFSRVNNITPRLGKFCVTFGNGRKTEKRSQPKFSVKA